MRTIDERDDHDVVAGAQAHVDDQGPARIRQDLLVVRRLGATRQHEQLGDVRHRMRDGVDRHSVQERVDQPVRVFGLDEILDRRRFGEQIADRRAAERSLDSSNAHGNLARRDRIGARRAATLSLTLYLLVSLGYLFCSQLALIALLVIFQQFRDQGKTPGGDVTRELLGLVKIYNAIPAEQEASYLSLLEREYAAFCKKH